MIDALKGRVEGNGKRDRSILRHLLTVEETGRAVFLPVVIYAVLLFANGGACIGWLRKWLWMPVEQYSYDALSTGLSRSPYESFVGFP